jgi:hypothetical protein
MHPAFAFYVYLCEISFPHDVGPYNNNGPGNMGLLPVIRKVIAQSRNNVLFD